MRPIVMRPIMCAAFLFAVACNSDSPTAAPTGAGLTVAPSLARDATELPFRGSFTAADRSVVVPPTLLLQGTGTGTGNHLGRFALRRAEVVNLGSATGTGTFDLTTANGDQIFATTAGGEDQFTPPNISHVTLVATIVGGTGRFAAASGTFTVEWTGIIDFMAGTSTSSGSFDGHINLR